jgi:hypothetical protein
MFLDFLHRVKRFWRETVIKVVAPSSAIEVRGPLQSIGKVTFRSLYKFPQAAQRRILVSPAQLC